MPTPFPQTPRHLLPTSIAHRKSLNLAKFGLLNWIELNLFEIYIYIYNGTWDLSVIYSLWFVLLGLLAGLCVPGCHRSCPGMSQGLDGVLHPGLTFGDEFNHSKYPVSSFPKRKGGLRLSVSLFSAQHLLTQLPGPSAMILSQFCTSGFLFADVCRCLG